MFLVFVFQEEVVFNGDEIGNKDYWGTVRDFLS